MSFLDIVLGGLLLFGLIQGMQNGLFVELASLLSFFVGIYIAIKFSSYVGAFFASSSNYMKIIAFVITLILVIVAIHLLAKVFSKIADFVFLGWLNKLGGAILSFLKTTLLLGIVLSLLLKVNLDNAIISKETQEKSLFFNPIVKTTAIFLPILNEWFTDLKSKTDSIEK
jgi:membrane protein required for colicin V production